jgi:hypothetical protein
MKQSFQKLPSLLVIKKNVGAQICQKIFCILRFFKNNQSDPSPALAGSG